MILLLLAAGVAPFFLKGPDGQPLMQMSDIKFSKLKLPWFGDKSNSADTTLHRWQDANGEWHYSDQAPEHASEQVHIDPNINVIQAPSTPPPAKSAPTRDTSHVEPKPVEPLKPSILNPGSLKDAVDETRNVREQVEQRHRDQQKRLNDQ